MECVIAGGGVIGLAIGRRLAEAGLGVLVVEKGEDFGLETSGRNSEVIHAGLYYPTGSLKARLCVEGRARLIDYLAARNLPHRLCGKLIVATDPGQRPALLALRDQAVANGVPPLALLSGAEAMALEPSLNAEMALLSPGTGIFDSRAYMLSLLGDLEAAGGALALRTTVTAVRRGGQGFVVETRGPDGEVYDLDCRFFINAAGHGASVLARNIETDGAFSAPETLFARGSYYAASGAPAFSRLIYPMPEPGGLGVHLTLDLAGSMRFGPDVEWIDRVDHTVNPDRREGFMAEIRRYFPGIDGRTIAPAYCGVRPKLSGPGQPNADFRIDGPKAHGTPGLVQLFGIESPGLTASLAIAEAVCRQLTG